MSGKARALATLLAVGLLAGGAAALGTGTADAAEETGQAPVTAIEYRPSLTRSGGADLLTPATFTVRSTLPGLVAYEAVFNDDPATRQTVSPTADGTGTFGFTVTRTGANWIDVVARDADGGTTVEQQEVWWPIDFPIVTSDDFPLGLLGAYGRRAPGTFALAPRRPGIVAYEWRIGTAWVRLPAAADGTATLTWTPERVGSHTIAVRGLTADGSRTDGTASWNFAVAVVNARAESVTPTAVTSGEKRVLTIRGQWFHPLDAVELQPPDGTAVRAKVTAVDPNGEWLTAEADFAGFAAGRVTVNVRGYGSTVGAQLADAITVAPPPALKITKAPAITGTVKVDATVKATAGTWSPGATTVKYQWRANGVAIKGATGSSYRITAAQAGKRLSVTVTASRAGNTTATATSAATAAVAKGPAAKNTRKPTVSGTPKAGRTVTAAVGTWSPAATSYRYEWRLNGKAVKGATGRSFKLTTAVRAKKVTVRVVAVRSGHLDGSATSAAVEVR